MRRWIGLTICSIFVFGVVAAYAAPVGNIATPAVLKKGLVIQAEEGEYGIIVASENDVVFDRNLKDQEDDSELTFFGGKLGILFLDRFIAYGLLGAGEALQKFNISGIKVKWETSADIIWGAGGTAILYETKVKELWDGILRIGVDGRYRQAYLDPDKTQGDPANFGISGGTLSESKYEFAEWQVAAALSYQMDQFIPYLGAKYSDAAGDATATVSGTDFKIDFEGDDNVGVFAGIDFLIQDSITINVEGRFIDESAVSAGAAIRF